MGLKILQINLLFLLPEDFEGTSVDAMNLLAQYHENTLSGLTASDEITHEYDDMSVKDASAKLLMDLLEMHKHFTNIHINGTIACVERVDNTWKRFPIR